MAKPMIVPNKKNITIAGPTIRSIYQTADNLLGIGGRAEIAMGTTVHALLLWALENIPPPVMRDILVKSKVAKEMYQQHRGPVPIVEERTGM